MTETLLFVALPYTAIALLVGGTLWRFMRDPLGVSSLSSQFLEGEQLLWGSVPWHFGIGLVFLGHLVPFLLPTVWSALVSNRSFLYSVEAVGFGAAMLCVLGLAVLLVRRLVTANLQPVTNPMDLLVLVLLLFQVLLGIVTAATVRWGAAWAPATVVPYVGGLLTLQPNADFIKDMPFVVRAHVVGAWLLVAVTPFSRLIHAFSVPWAYLARPHQRVVWNNARFLKPVKVQAEITRRHFIRAGVALAAGAGLLSLGVLDKLLRFFQGPKLSLEDQLKVQAEKLTRSEQTADERKLLLERMEKDFIAVASFAELKKDLGKYFIDYQMRPALAFQGVDGWPLLISAKCTHLGCTVGSQVDAQGKILCPCHVSRFDLQTGEPQPGDPAKAPLPRLPWVVMNGAGQVLASRDGDGKLQKASDATPEALKAATVYIAKREGVAV